MFSDDEFTRLFVKQAWPLEQWHHREHVRLAYLYLTRYSFSEAADRIRVGIKAHNAANKIFDTPTSGYHETMTIAWLRLVQFVIGAYGQCATSDEFCDDHPELMERKALRLFYSRDLFMSSAAKMSFVEPDLTAFPRFLTRQTHE